MGGETTRVENRGETTREETTRGETSWGRNVLLPCQAVELNSCLGRNGFVKPAHAMFRNMTQTVLQPIIKHKSVLAISRIFFLKKNGWNCHTRLRQWA